MWQVEGETASLALHYISDGCYRYTFRAKKVLAHVQSIIQPEWRILNLFAGQYRLGCGAEEIRVDSSNEFEPDFHMTADEFLQSEHNTGDYDAIIWDPPWNERKSKEFYDGRYVGKFTRLKNATVASLKPGGIIISCGYEITNFGKVRGMELVSVAVVNPHGEIRPYFVVVEQKA